MSHPLAFPKGEAFFMSSGNSGEDCLLLLFPLPLQSEKSKRKQRFNNPLQQKFQWIKNKQ